MNKIIKVISIVLMVLVLTTTISNVCSAADQVIGTMSGFAPASDQKVTSIAKTILGYIQLFAIVVGVIIIAMLGLKYMMGSTEEKAVTKKAFIPLIIGIVLVVCAGEVAKLLFSMAQGK